ncbi:MAG: hypothetical protein NZ554_03060 [Bryobacteraceae bacterium]|nr:hypothetical protein [Bryobacteraceae bacterium]
MSAREHVDGLVLVSYNGQASWACQRVHEHLLRTVEILVLVQPGGPVAAG